MKRISFIAFLLAFVARSTGQTAWFIDGYHGGIYGHIPSWQTRFMVDKLQQFPDWRINLELEPESWDTIKVHDPAAYEDFRKLMAVPDGRVEYINPCYGQSYLYTVSGESIIRQFYYGMKKLREHFPSIQFTTYSSEEPCFTSALPQLLRSYGFKYASLKNPNTCWGGYTRAFGGELVDWIGPDGSSILTVPRYGMEALQPASTWQTIAFENAPSYVKGALAAGIPHPVGMTLQDAGWAYGPWLHPRRGQREVYEPSKYATWREYFEKVADTSRRRPWHFSQEDVLVSLMWGSQVLQRIAREVRSSEDKILQAEKVAAMRCVMQQAAWPGDALDAAWRTLLLSQHHDCWIVPYNGRHGDTWADKVVRWTGYTDSVAQQVIGAAGGMVVYNTTAVDRKEWVEVGGKLLYADVPAMGYANLVVGRSATPLKTEPATAVRLPDGTYKLETDLYRLIIDPARGGIIRSLRARTLGNKEFAGEGFNGLRGNFYNDGGFRGSMDSAAGVEVIGNGPREKVIINGTIAGNPFTQELTLTMGEPLIDVRLHIDWKGNPGIGESAGPSSDQEMRKSYYDDRYKLLALFPPAWTVGKVYKNAPFDVTESRLDNTFFNRWDSIKNNVLLNWVDVEDRSGKYGLALFSDHTTSYVHGEGYPLGLTVQYSGNGIFYRNYRIDGPTEIHYALLPHADRWDRAGVEAASARWNEPLVVTRGREGPSRSFIRPTTPGWEITSMRMEGKDLLVRIFNAAGDDKGRLQIGFRADEVWLVELNGRKVKKLSGSLSIPRYGVRTIRFINARI